MKRWLLKLALLLVLGAIVNVAVAWGLAWSMGRDTQIATEITKPGGVDTGDATVVQRYRFVYRKPGLEVTTAVDHQGGILVNRLQLDPPVYFWSLDYSGTWRHADQPPNRGASTTHLAGWPLLACHGRREEGPVTNPMSGPASVIGVNGLLHVGDATGGRWFPLLPIWPGFAINTVFYAGVLWLLFAAPFALRRRRRIKRGLCPKCAYDLRGSANAAACPECGTRQSITPRGSDSNAAKQARASD